MSLFTKHLVIFILFINIHQLSAQEPVYLNVFQELNIDETYSLFGDNVNLREKPNTTSKEITRLRIGFDVKIIAKTAVIFENGINKTPWYEVEYNNLRGFIPGQFIAHKTLTYNTHTIFFTKRFSKKNGEELAIRLLKDDDFSNYTENTMQLRGADVGALIESNHDLKNVQYILKIKHYGDSCGAENGNTYFFINNLDEMVFVAHLSVNGDALYYESETFTFQPNPNTGNIAILFTKEESEVIDEVTEWTKTKSMSRYYEWDGTKLVPEFSKKYYNSNN